MPGEFGIDFVSIRSGCAAIDPIVSMTKFGHPPFVETVP